MELLTAGEYLRQGGRGRADKESKNGFGIHQGYRLQKLPGQSRIDTAATLRAAAPFQGIRVSKGQKAVQIEPEDLRYERLLEKERRGILFAVDTSRSQGMEKRLAFAKGAVFSLLDQIYCSREYVGVITFGNGEANCRLPFTRSVEYAKKCLQEIPAAGNTPLGMGLRMAYEMIMREKRKRQKFAPVLVVLTDGKANFDKRPGNPMQLAIQAAEMIKAEGIPSYVIDTERGAFNLGLAEKLAKVLGALYLQLD